MSNIVLGKVYFTLGANLAKVANNLENKMISDKQGRFEFESRCQTFARVNLPRN